MLTVGEHGKVKAKIAAKTVVVVGKVWGSIIAAENVDIRDTSLVEGDICTPRLAMAAGAYVRGRIDIRQSQSGRPVAASTADSGVDVPDKPRAQYAAKPETGPATGAPRLKWKLRPGDVPGAAVDVAGGVRLRSRG